MPTCPSCGDGNPVARRLGGDARLGNTRLGGACLVCPDCGHVWRGTSDPSGDPSGDPPADPPAPDAGLASLPDPRGTLRRSWRDSPPGAILTIETPVDDPPDAPFPAGERHRFDADGARRLTTRCGFILGRERSEIRAGRRWSIIEAIRAPAPGGAETALGYLAALTVSRRAAGARIASMAVGWGQAGAGAGREGARERPALWGLGTDLEAMAAENPILREGLEAGRFALFDRAAAGEHRAWGPVLSPDGLPWFDGVVLLTPSSPETRRGMRAAAAGWPDGGARVVDPYRPPPPSPHAAPDAAPANGPEP